MKYTLISLTLLLALNLSSQTPEQNIKTIFNNALTDSTAESHLYYLCKNTIGRIPGSAEALHAVDYTKQALIDAGADSVWLQEVPVPHWERGEEKAVLHYGSSTAELTISALGLSVGTGKEPVETGIVEVMDFNELKALGEDNVRNKIVFFNRPADPTVIRSFSGYGGAVNQRTEGASYAAELGALAVIVRSPTQAKHDFVHTGVVRYKEGINKIPAVTVSPYDADMLSAILRETPGAELSLLSDCRNFPDTISYNVIGEIRGSELPNEFITVGGHLDAWDISEGAHDDAGGCVQSIEMIRLFKETGIRPKRSVRAVMFMNEEMTSTGGLIYAEQAKLHGETHYAALESDRGVMSPLGFGFGASGERLDSLVALQKYFSPYGIKQFFRGGGGSDISPLRSMGTLLMGYIPDTQRYFWF
ncbi:MAG: M28 family peptidase, partial [Bacteroidales bacterium]|nr:M28 family peptidase [Bacteroidales bacterium]